MRKLIIYICSIIFLVSCGQSYEEKQAISRAEKARLKRQDSLALKVAVLPTLDCMPVYLAKVHNLFDTTKVDVHLRLWNAQMDADAALMAGSIEGAVTDFMRVDKMKSRGVELDILGSTNAYWQLIANHTARIKHVSQLGDKMVAMTRYSATDYLTDKVLEGVKTSASVFRIQINDVTVRLHMLLNNEMDAMWLTEPQATTARLYKNPVLKDSRELKEKSLGVVAFRSQALADRRRQQQIVYFVKGYNAACDSINKYGLKHYADLVKTYCKTDEKTLKALPELKYIHISDAVVGSYKKVGR
ncbi:ABC transporter substrate-binding protein [Prevotella sp. KH2C16]|uniref:ABC transporter substrate-binding protein n=1 Tax=Prevotella sp. KH2C16 TaxID=1855325 RepID=UPI0008DEB846|nr:ABC transporter substrate-binding protein [Prevotella sp. KH2C16]SFG10817.1 NitT/TauT family transport system substrate-binding protein [Prevotella sp. KH2C16]